MSGQQRVWVGQRLSLSGSDVEEAGESSAPHQWSPGACAHNVHRWDYTRACALLHPRPSIRSSRPQQQQPWRLQPAGAIPVTRAPVRLAHWPPPTTSPASDSPLVPCWWVAAWGSHSTNRCSLRLAMGRPSLPTASTYGCVCRRQGRGNEGEERKGGTSDRGEAQRDERLVRPDSVSQLAPARC